MKRWFGFLQGILLATVVFLAGTPQVVAQSSELQPVLDRMERLERDIRTLNLRLARGGGTSSSGTTATGATTSTSDDVAHIFARLDVRLNSLEEELRATTGRVEDLSFQVNQLNQRLDKLVGDVDYRLTTLERSRAAAPGSQQTSQPPQVSAVPAPPPVERAVPGAADPTFAKPPGTLGTITDKDMRTYGSRGATLQPAAPAVPTPAPVAAPATVLPAGTPKEQYTYAFGLLRKANYDKAEEALQEFLKVNGDDPLAGNARYWLGETYYVRGQYVEAAEVFLRGYQSDPKSAKAPDTLLKLGMSLTNLDKKREACAAFEKLEVDFPDASASIKNTMAKERKRGGC